MRATLALALATCAISAGCERPGAIPLPDAALPADAGAMIDARPGFSDSAIATEELALDHVVPDHGPFTGGNRVVLRGTGFTEDARVSIGGRAVQPADHELVDSRRLAVVAPAGDVGPADVSVEIGDQRVVLEDAYVYDAISVEPPRGSSAGGTFVTITGRGTAFEAGATVVFGRTQCTDVSVVSATRITCRTPASAPGTVDVVVRSDGDAVAGSAEDAFRYYDASDPITGGLGGGPIRGSLDITVIDASTRAPIEGAFAILGEDLSTEHQGVTDALGRITLSGPELAGPVTLHVTKDCYQRTSVLAFDASNVTLFLRRWDPVTGPLRCRPTGEPGPGGPGRSLAFVEGELIWRGPHEFAPNPWDNIPEPTEGWERVAYVYTTVRDLGLPNPDPAAGGSKQRVLEVIPDDGQSHLGYPYRILADPRGLAVFAVAGLQERSGQRRFVPHVMGVARSVLPGPGDTLTGVDMVMDLVLDREVDVELGTLPPPPSTAPDRFRAQVFVDLPGEGLIRRRIGSQDFDTIRGDDGSVALRVAHQPALAGVLEDARYRVTAGWFSGASESAPFTYAVLRDVSAADAPVVMPDFLGIPDAVAPLPGEPLPADRVLRWSHAGPPGDLQWILLFGSDGNLAWEIFAPGVLTAAPLPDLSALPDLFDVPEGTIVWQHRSLRIVGFDFDELRYVELDERYWTHSARNDFVVRR